MAIENLTDLKEQRRRDSKRPLDTTGPPLEGGIGKLKTEADLARFIREEMRKPGVANLNAVSGLSSRVLGPNRVTDDELADGAAGSRQVTLESGLVVGTGAQFDMPSAFVDVGVSASVTPEVDSYAMVTTVFAWALGVDTAASIPKAWGALVVDGSMDPRQIFMQTGVFDGSGGDFNVQGVGVYRVPLAAGSHNLKLQTKGNFEDNPGSLYTRCITPECSFSYFLFAQEGANGEDT